MMILCLLLILFSWDKYYYEPMENVINEWKVAFNCKNSQSSKDDLKYRIHEQKFSTMQLTTLNLYHF